MINTRASYSARVVFRNKCLRLAVFNRNGPFYQLIKIIACARSQKRADFSSTFDISLPPSARYKFFYMQTKLLSNNMPARRVLIEIPRGNNRPIQSTILSGQPHCKRNKVCKIYRHGRRRRPRTLVAYTPSDRGINYYYILQSPGSPRGINPHFIYNVTSYRGTAGIV